MKLIRNLCTAIALAACAAAPTLATADEAPVRAEITLQDQVDMVRADVAEGVLSCTDLMTRINNLLARIDTQLDDGTGNKLELLKLRNVVLSTRSLVKCTAHAEHTANGTELTGSCPSCSGGPVVAGPSFVGGPIAGGSVAPTGFFSNGGILGGGGGGAAGSGASIGGGGLGIGALGAIGAAIAIPIAASSSDDGPGPVASPSN